MLFNHNKPNNSDEFYSMFQFFIIISNQKSSKMHYLKIISTSLKKTRFESIYKTISSFNFK